MFFILLSLPRKYPLLSKPSPPACNSGFRLEKILSLKSQLKKTLKMSSGLFFRRKAPAPQKPLYNYRLSSTPCGVRSEICLFSVLALSHHSLVISVMKLSMIHVHEMKVTFSSNDNLNRSSLFFVNGNNIPTLFSYLKYVIKIILYGRPIQVAVRGQKPAHTLISQNIETTDS